MVSYQRATVHTVDDVRAIADHAGSHFFSPDTMRFWKSRLLSGVTALDGHAAKPGARFLFVTSDIVPDGVRVYSLRMMTLGSTEDNRPSVDIERLSSYDNAREARKAAQQFTYLAA